MPETIPANILFDLALSQSRSMARHNIKIDDVPTSVYVRKAKPKKRAIIYGSLFLISRGLFRTKLIQNNARSYQLAVVDEAYRLHDLARRGIRVPKLYQLIYKGHVIPEDKLDEFKWLTNQCSSLPLGQLHSFQDEPKMMKDFLATLRKMYEPLTALMMEDMNSTDMSYVNFMDFMQELPVGDRLKWWKEGLSEIKKVHDKGTSLSEAFMRNMMVAPSKEPGVHNWCFLDFEEDPSLTLTLGEAHVRDILLYLHSGAAFLEEKEDEAIDFLKRHMSLYEGDEIEILKSFTRKVSWVANRNDIISKLGTDGRHLAAALRFLKRLEHM